MTRAAIFALACCVFFCAAGLLFAPLLGTENDESLFGSALYAPPAVNSIQVAGHSVPLMLMSYLGALKGWLYAPVFGIWAPGPYSVRIPPIVMGAATVWLFFLLLRRVAGERVAAIGAVLLATDSLFFLTTVFDWGPVALQHLLTVGGLLALVRFLDNTRAAGKRDVDVAVALFLLGLALWDKAISIWLFAGLGVATLAAYPREFVRLLTIRRMLVAASALVLGASPLIFYNFRSDFATFHQDSGLAPEEILPKFTFLVQSLHGGLFGWITRTAWPWPVANLLGVLFVTALLLWPLVWKRNAAAGRLMWFGLVVLTVAWLAMAITHNAGASVHHTILLWPFPQLVVALALGQAWQKDPVGPAPQPARRSTTEQRIGPALGAFCTALVVLVAAHNLFVIHRYRQDIRERGSTLGWTEAIYSLAAFTQPLPTQYFILDWGILENLVLLREGKLALHAAWYPLMNSTLSDTEKKMVGEWVSGSSSVFLAHVRGSETFHGCREALDALTHEMGLREVPIELIRDSHGKPIFEAFRFTRP